MPVAPQWNAWRRVWSFQLFEVPIVQGTKKLYETPVFCVLYGSLRTLYDERPQEPWLTTIQSTRKHGLLRYGHRSLTKWWCLFPGRIHHWFSLAGNPDWSGSMYRVSVEGPPAYARILHSSPASTISSVSGPRRRGSLASNSSHPVLWLSVSSTPSVQIKQGDFSTCGRSSMNIRNSGIP